MGRLISQFHAKHRPTAREAPSPSSNIPVNSYTIRSLRTYSKVDTQIDRHLREMHRALGVVAYAW